MALLDVSSFSPFSVSSVSSYDIFSPYKRVDILSPASNQIITTDLLYTYSPTTVDRITLSSDSDLRFFPTTTSLNLTYSKPLLGVYNDLNSDPAVHKRISKMIRMKTLDKWLYEDLKEILGYFQVNDKTVDVISNLNNFNPSAALKDSDDVIEKKIDFIEKYFLTSRFVNKVLTKFVRNSNSEWVKIPHSQFYVRQKIGDELTKLIKQAIKEKKA